jgi:2-keto-4-pentenoate hydratase/2-oxohepta-3-ene-1,7-dioic acid hydratase in catechol pathway
VGPNEDIVLPEKVREKTMPAVELGVVIGTDSRYLTEEEVLDAIAGYTVCNDITARTDWPGPMAYKLMDTFWPIGPAITPPDQVSNPTNLSMRLEKDGEVICRGTTASMRFSIPFVVSHVSSILKLRPGDIISTGDPGRVESRIEPGTKIEAIIKDVGCLSNPVVED